MFKGKKDKVLTIVLIIAIVGIVAAVGFVVYDTVWVKSTEISAEEKANEFINKTTNTVSKKKSTNKTEENVANEDVDLSNFEDLLISQRENEESKVENEEEEEEETLEGYKIKGVIEIPATEIKYPILEKVETKSLKTAVAILYPEGAELNQPGNVTIAGHNYRNKLFFSNNDKLEIGDTIYITDNSGQRITYSIYDKFYTTPSDTEYMVRDTQGAREISLTTCNDDSSERLIILAKEK